MQKLPMKLPDDFRDRCRDVRKRQASGEDFNDRRLAEALGMPVVFITVALVIAQVLATGQPVTILPEDFPPTTAH